MIKKCVNQLIKSEKKTKYKNQVSNNNAKIKSSILPWTLGLFLSVLPIPMHRVLEVELKCTAFS